MRGLQKTAEAEEQYQLALGVQHKLADEDRANHSYRDVIAQIHANLGALFADCNKWAEAESQHRQAIAIREKLAAEYPTLPYYQLGLGRRYSDLGLLLCHRGQPALSLSWFDRSIRILTAVREQDRSRVQAKVFLRDSYWGRAYAYSRSEKFAEALKDWDRAIELSPPAERPGLRASRAASQIQAGMVAEAVAEVAELTAPGANATGLANWTAGQWYNFACVYAIGSTKIAGKKQEYADRAMELLQKAVKAGFKYPAHMKQDKDLDALRDREDFKKLVAELGAPTKK